MKRLDKLRAAVTLYSVSVIMGCSSYNYVEYDSPTPKISIAPLLEKPRVALVLGSGGPRGYAHIGILRVLDEFNVPIDMVVGTSVGSVIGSFLAAGYSIEEIQTLSKQGGPLTLFDPSIFADRGWIKGQKLQNYVNQKLGNKTIEELKIPFVAVATKLVDYQPVFFDNGNVGVAVRASSAVPNIISPVGINGIEYIDGDESLPLAVTAAVEAGADFIIAVDVLARANAVPADASIFEKRREASRRARIQPEASKADFLFHPDLDYNAGPWKSYFDAVELEGEQYARAKIQDLLAKLAEKNIHF